MTARNRLRLRPWRLVRRLAVPILLWGLCVGLLVATLRTRLHGNEVYDQAALREWVEESRSFRESLPDLVRRYLAALDPAKSQPELLPDLTEEIRDHLQALCEPTKLYQAQLPLFPAIYRLELEIPGAPPGAAPLVWESQIPRPRGRGEVERLAYPLLGPEDPRAILHFEYQLHAFNKRQRDEQAANQRIRWAGALAAGGTLLAFWWITLVQNQERERERQRALAKRKIDEAERLLLTGELRRQAAERKQEETERKLLEQQLATREAEQRALEMKSQLYASIGIMAGSYAHNIKNLLVRPNDLLRRCLESDSLPSGQGEMLEEVRETLGTVTERLQQILQTVRRDPSRSELAPLDLNEVAAEIGRTWERLAEDRWKATLALDLAPGALVIRADRSHVQQAMENLLFNARDATFEMRNDLREQARRRLGVDGAAELAGSEGRQALIAAAGWKGRIVVRTRREGGEAVLEIEDNGIGMTEEVRRRCTETHFSTKRNNAVYEGNTTGMGLGLSFVEAVLQNHGARLEIESAPQRGAVFRLRFPPLAERSAAAGDAGGAASGQGSG